MRKIPAQFESSIRCEGNELALLIDGRTISIIYTHFLYTSVLELLNIVCNLPSLGTGVVVKFNSFSLLRCSLSRSLIQYAPCISSAYIDFHQEKAILLLKRKCNFQLNCTTKSISCDEWKWKWKCLCYMQYHRKAYMLIYNNIYFRLKSKFWWTTINFANGFLIAVTLLFIRIICQLIYQKVHSIILMAVLHHHEYLIEFN